MQGKNAADLRVKPQVGFFARHASQRVEAATGLKYFVDISSSNSESQVILIGVSHLVSLVRSGLPRNCRVPEIDSITIKGFKSIASVEKLKLGAINIVIGPNGSGKSNFIGVFSFLRAIREGRLKEYVASASGADNLLHFGSKRTPELSVRIWFRDEVDGYEITLRRTDDDRLVPSSEWFYRLDQQISEIGPLQVGPLNWGAEAGISQRHLAGISGSVVGHFDQWRLYHFHDTSSTSPLRKTADLHDNHFLRADGSNIVSFLYLLQERHDDARRRD